jgi:tetratricopeptide (TPR) repeat protein
MLDNSNELIKNYLLRVVAFKDSLLGNITNADLERIATDMGLSSADLQLLNATAENHLKRGDTYLNLQKWEDALNEYLQAHSLQPLNSQFTARLAHYYLEKYTKTKQKKDLYAAEQWAKQTLQISANHTESIQILQKVEQKKKAAKRKIIVWGIILAILITFTAFGVFIVADESGFFIPPAHQLDGTEYAVPIYYEPTPDDGIEITSLHSVIAHQETYSQGNVYHNFVLKIKNTRLETVRLRLGADYITEDGQTVGKAEYLWIIANTDYTKSIFTFRPADIYFTKNMSERFTLPNNKPVKIKEIRLYKNEIEQYAPQTVYPPSPEIEKKWSCVKNDSLDISFGLRAVELGAPYDEEKTVDWNIALEISNTGKYRINHLVIAFEFYDENGQLKSTSSDIDIINLAQKNMLEVGERMLWDYFERLGEPLDYKKPYQAFKVNVRSIR